jgi:hypothetical protein
MTHKLTISVPVYEYKCYVIISDDIVKTLRTYIKKNKWEMIIGHDDAYEGMAISVGNLKEYYIFFNMSDLTSSCIAHEVSHHIGDVCLEKDIPLTGESRSYLTGYITEQIMDFAIKKNLYKNKWLKVEEKK